MTERRSQNQKDGPCSGCPFCGEAFVRRSNRSVICGKPECVRARKRMNQRNCRSKKKVEAQKSK